MKLLNEITDLLMSEKGSLTDALLRTKVLLHRIGQSELVGWVDAELAGYDSGCDLPDYRKLKGTVLGTVTNGYYTYTEQQIPLRHLEASQRDSLRISNLTPSVGVIEKMVLVPKSKYGVPVEPEICAHLSAVLQEGYYIQSAANFIQHSQFQQVLMEVRSRLLSFILKLQDELGEEMSDSEAKQVAATIDVPSMFNGAVIGSNATFQILGVGNQQHVRNTLTAGNLEELANELRKSKVAEVDIVELGEAIDADRDYPVTSTDYGPKVTHWLKGMVGKAVSGAWGVNIAIATNVLTTAVQKYYGLN